MAKYKAIVKYKLNITDNMEFDSNCDNPSDVMRELKDKIDEDVHGYGAGFFTSDDVEITFEVADITPDVSLKEKLEPINWA